MLPIVFFFFGSINGAASNVDSLLNTLETETNDTNRIRIYYALTGELTYTNPDSSILFCKRGIELSEKMPYPKGGALMFMELGTIYTYKGEYKEALKYTFRALDLFEFIEDARGIASANGNAGIIFWYMEDYEKAVNYYQESANVYLELNDSAGVARQYNNIGLIHNDQQDYEKAAVLFKKALAINTALDRETGIAKCLNNLGISYEQLGEYELAKSYYQQALEIRRRIGDINGTIISMNNYGNLLSKTGDAGKAKKILTESLDLAIALNFPEGERYAYEYLSDASILLNDFEAAYYYLEQQTRIEDSLKNSEKHEQIAEFEARYQSEKKEKEISLLQTEKAERSLVIAQQKSTNRLKTIVILSLISFFIILLLFIFIVFKNYREKKEKELRAVSQEIEFLRKKIDVQLENSEENRPFEISRTNLNKHFIDPLTEREIEILQLVATGKTNKMISTEIFISENTVKYHLKNIYVKLDVKNRTEALAKASTMQILIEKG